MLGKPQSIILDIYCIDTQHRTIPGNDTPTRSSVAVSVDRHGLRELVVPAAPPLPPAGSQHSLRGSGKPHCVGARKPHIASVHV